MSENSSKGILIPQKHYGMTFFSVWIMLITTVQWIMLDMYLPALPVLTEELGVTEALLNVSLNAGILLSAVGTLISGVLSDRYGRKPILLAGFGLNILGSFACAACSSVYVLIAMRGVQGLGDGFVLTITTAIIKDSLTGRRFQTTMTVLQSIAAVGPIFAPALGSLIINLWSWRAIFLFLGGISLVTMLPMLISTETWPRQMREGADLRQVLRGAGTMMTNRAFLLFLAIMSALTIPVWAYVSVSSYVYINEFGLSNITYGVYYSTGAVMSCLAPFIYLLLARIFRIRRVVSIAIAVLALGAGILLAGGRFSPLIFMISVFPIMISEGIIRPLGIIVLLEEFSDAVGTTSAWMHFIINVVGVVGTTLATLPWHSMITGLGLITAGCTGIGILCWGAILRQGLLKRSL